MKKIILLIFSLCITLMIQATSLSVVSTPGALYYVIMNAGGNPSTITNLTVTGTIDASDFEWMQTNLPVLSVLDISGVNIAAYTGTGGTAAPGTYGANIIPPNAFDNTNTGAANTSLTSVIIPLSATSIGDQAFMYCTHLTSMTIPSSVTTIGVGAFELCYNLTSVTIPSSVYSIGGSAFYGCFSLTSITIPSSVVIIQDYTFFECQNLTSITIPSSVTHIGEEAFYMSGLNSITIPSSVMSIDEAAFQDCSSLTSITIPASFEYLGADAFSGCTHLTSIYAYPTTPVDLTYSPYVFSGVNPNCTLYVPTNSINSYENAVQWENFYNIVGIPATVTLSGLTATYDGTAKTVTATTYPSVSTVNITYNGSTTAPTAVGTYPIIATISDATYQGSATGSLVISKATATVSLSGLTPIYDGTAKTVTATTTPSGLAVDITYNSSTSAPTAAGTYPIVATINDATYQGSATGTLTISPTTTATITLNSSAVAYTCCGSSPITFITATTNPSDLAVTITYGGSTTVPTAVGTYSVVATINDPNNYVGFPVTATGSLTISQVPATITLNDSTVVYTGSPIVVTTAKTTPSGLAVTYTYDGLTTVPTAVGTYTVVATINDPNYVGTATGSLVISKATANITLGGLTPTYDGTEKTGTYTTNPGGLTVNITYDGSTTAPTAAGNYPIIATISDPNYQGSATGTLTISKATTARISVSDLTTTTYDGTAKTVTATTHPSDLAVTITYNGNATAPTNAGTYTVVATISDTTDYQVSPATGSLVISKAPANITLSGLTPTYDGTGKTVTATTTPNGLIVGIIYDGSTTAPTVAGTYPIIATISDPNYQGSVNGSLTISQATATITLNDSTVVYDGSTIAVTTAKTVPSGLAVTYTYNGSATAPINADTYPVVATISDPDYQGSTTGQLTISQATASVTLGDSTATYDGTAKTITASTTPSGLNVTYTYADASGNALTAAPTAVGTYTVTGTISDTNYIGSGTGQLTISQATASVTLSDSTATYDGTAKTITASTTPSGLNVTYTYADASGNALTAAPTAVGVYTVTGTISDTNYQGSTTGTLTISQATATITLGGLTATYGTPILVTATTDPSDLAVTITYDGSTTVPTAVGTYTVVATISDANYQGSTTGSLVISGVTGTINTETSQVDIIAYNNILKVSGVKIGDVISVYTLNSTLLFNMKATQETEYIYSLKDGLYIVSVPAENIARKVLVH